MDIRILTYYGVHNHGAVLQANALKQVLESFGHQVEFLSFQRNYDFLAEGASNKYRISIRSIPLYCKYLADKGIGNVLFNIKKNRLLDTYRKHNIRLHERYNEFTGDAIIIGSDEVFSLEIGINPFFYGHGLRAERIISYAGCFGPTTAQDIKRLGLEAMIGSGFERMSAISVRDENSKAVVEAYSSQNATIVCDPVILYGYFEEQLMFTPPEKRYIVVYSYDKNMNDSDEIHRIRCYAKKRNLKILSVGYHHKWCDKNINVTPEELLGYIKGADLVITDTFHGSVMAIVCNTPFVARVRGNGNKLRNLLREYGVEERISEDFSDLDVVASKPIDFEFVNLEMQRRRAASKKFLSDALEEMR